MFQVICTRKCIGCPVGRGKDREGVPYVTKLLWEGSHLPDGVTLEEHKVAVMKTCPHSGEEVK